MSGEDDFDRGAGGSVSDEPAWVADPPEGFGNVFSDGQRQRILDAVGRAENGPLFLNELESKLSSTIDFKEYLRDPSRPTGLASKELKEIRKRTEDLSWLLRAASEDTRFYLTRDRMYFDDSERLKPLLGWLQQLDALAKAAAPPVRGAPRKYVRSMTMECVASLYRDCIGEPTKTVEGDAGSDGPFARVVRVVLEVLGDDVSDIGPVVRRAIDSTQ